MFFPGLPTTRWAVLVRRPRPTYALTPSTLQCLQLRRTLVILGDVVDVYLTGDESREPLGQGVLIFQRGKNHFCLLARIREAVKRPRAHFISQATINNTLSRDKRDDFHVLTADVADESNRSV